MLEDFFLNQPGGFTASFFEYASLMHLSSSMQLATRRHAYFAAARGIAVLMLRVDNSGCCQMCVPALRGAQTPGGSCRHAEKDRQRTRRPFVCAFWAPITTQAEAYDLFNLQGCRQALLGKLGLVSCTSLVKGCKDKVWFRAAWLLAAAWNMVFLNNTLGSDHAM